MIRKEKFGSAMFAMSTVLVLARAIAYDKRSFADLAAVLDVAEHLPRLVSEDKDQTEEFRNNLVLLANRDAAFELAIRRFDQPCPERW